MKSGNQRRGVGGGNQYLTLHIAVRRVFHSSKELRASKKEKMSVTLIAPGGKESRLELESMEGLTRTRVLALIVYRYMHFAIILIKEGMVQGIPTLDGCGCTVEICIDGRRY